MLYTINTPGLAINTYLIVDPTTKKAAVIDPVRDVEPLLQKIRETGAKVIAILETHVHADFVSGAKELKHRLNEIPTIYCSRMGGERWTPSYADCLVGDREAIALGSFRLEAWHTPGHTPEHLMWVLYDDKKNKDTPLKAFTGDFLFVGSIGRPDLLGAEEMHDLADKLYTSVFEILPQLPDSIEIYPAHGAGSVCGKGISAEPSSTLAFEQQNNPSLHPQPKKEWFKALMEQMPPRPDYFLWMKELNVVGPDLLEDLPSIQEVTWDQIDRDTQFILDVRSKEEFSKHHPGSAINIGLGSLFVNWVARMAPYDRPIVLCGDDKTQCMQASTLMHLVGLDNQVAYLLLDGLNMPTASYPMVSPRELHDWINGDPKNVLVLDVRSDREWHAGHIEGAKHIVLDNLPEEMHKLPKNKSIAVTCGAGYRASIGVSLLQREGYEHVSNLAGGMQRWFQEGLPTTHTE